MPSPLLSLSRRTRQTPFTSRVLSAGVRAFTVYNHMLLPTVFTSLEDDYRHLKTQVQLWDVACERQVEIRGPHAARLTQMLTPRDLAPMESGQCFYTPMVDETGGMLNDPVLIRVAEDRFWVSVADSDLLFWIKGLAYAWHLEVDVSEPDISPLAVQGPLAEDLMARVFGERVREIRFFRFETLEFQGAPLVVARSGYSKQGGFEIYVTPNELAGPLWDALFAAGEDLDVRAGCPNLIERVESGMLSYGNDMTRENTPHECGLARFCNTWEAIGCVGRDALLRVARDGPVRQIRGFLIDGDRVDDCLEPWSVVADGELVGQITSAVWSPDAGTNVAIGMVSKAHWMPGTMVSVHTPSGERNAMVCSMPHRLPFAAHNAKQREP
ncbi:MAG: dimethylsulfoniopropionate demethylase [Gammaproteobacteria bacterium]|jgi:dimethylsulfoniopropionate demethylase